MHLMIASSSCDYKIRNFYKEPEHEYNLENLWEITDLMLDPNCLPFKSVKSNFGEMLIRIDTFKTRTFLLKYVGRHFVFIKDNERKVIPICSHSR